EGVDGAGDGVGDDPDIPRRHHPHPARLREQRHGDLRRGVHDEHPALPAHEVAERPPQGVAGRRRGDGDAAVDLGAHSA
ncbi:Os06g0155050, partial [Oryza sativa Japonica Group]